MLTSWLIDRRSDRPTDRPAGRSTDWPTDWPSKRSIARPTNRPTDWPTDRSTDRPIDRPIDRRTHERTGALCNERSSRIIRRHNAAAVLSVPPTKWMQSHPLSLFLSVSLSLSISLSRWHQRPKHNKPPAENNRSSPAARRLKRLRKLAIEDANVN